MDARTKTNSTNPAARFFHRHLLALLLSAYALAALTPAWGNWLREVRPTSLLTGGAGSGWTPALPSVMLGFLLFQSGLRVRRDRVVRIARRPGLLLAGLAANLVVPVLYLLALIPILDAWHNPPEAAAILAGLALVAAMPVAGSSTGWAQSAGGDMALSLGLVLGSTVLSPLTTPLALGFLGGATPSGHGEALRRLAGIDAGFFLLTWVLVPSFLGMTARRLLGVERAALLEDRLSPLGPVVLLILCYANASASLPKALGNPDWDFLLVTFGCVLGLCFLMYACGYAISRALGADRDQRSALMFGLGMNNNGTGQVLAAVALASQPLAMIPIIAYNLSQHVVASFVYTILRRGPRPADAPNPLAALRSGRPEVEPIG